MIETPKEAQKLYCRKCLGGRIENDWKMIAKETQFYAPFIHTEKKKVMSL